MGVCLLTLFMDDWPLVKPQRTTKGKHGCCFVTRALRLWVSSPLIGPVGVDVAEDSRSESADTYRSWTGSRLECARAGQAEPC